jgi:hypothetical protein
MEKNRQIQGAIETGCDANTHRYKGALGSSIDHIILKIGLE